MRTARKFIHTRVGRKTKKVGSRNSSFQELEMKKKGSLLFYYFTFLGYEGMKSKKVSYFL